MGDPFARKPSNVLLISLFFFCSVPLCSEPLPSGVNPSKEDIKFTLQVGRIIIRRKNVFEIGTKADQRFPYSWGNKLHIVTKEECIRQELLFHEGETFDRERIVESERLLRSRPIFRYVTITPQDPVDGRVDVLIETEDVWTTSVQLAYGTAGGKHFYRLGVLEHNFLGRGRRAGAFLRQDIDRFVRGVSYRDPRFLGTRWELTSGYGQDQKGREMGLSLERPYFSVRTPHAEGASILTKTDENQLFENGVEVAKFRQETSSLRAFFSRALGPFRDEARRVALAYAFEENIFSDIYINPSVHPPKNRVISALLASLEVQSVRYIKKRGVNTFDRDEDINLGWHWMAEAGPFLRSLGSTRNGTLAEGGVQNVFRLSEDQLWFLALLSKGRIEGNRLRNSVFRVQNQYVFLNWFNENILNLRMEYAAGKNFDEERQFLLGGENGLRGYSVRQFSGSKKAFMTLENRKVIAYDWLHLVTWGWAVFADAGAVWKENQEPSFRSFKGDVGFGIRFAPSRSVDPTLLRMDVAYALSDNQRRSRWVLNIGADLRFGEKIQRKFDQ